ncbi:MAG: hypothetical protein Q7R62_02865 [bacterium]|nr:hypothetical protein [bacterium]
MELYLLSTIMARINYPSYLKIEARKLRTTGLSYGEISKKLEIVKSTARMWCKDIRLSIKLKERLYKAGVIKMTSGPNSARPRRQREIKKIIGKARLEINEPINATALKLLGAMLYWAEGEKTHQFGIANSDPLLIKFMVEWWKKVFQIKSSDFTAFLNIYPQQNEREIKKFWSELTEIPLENFGKSFIKPKNKKYKKNTLYYGTIKIRMHKGSDSRHRVFAWVNKMLELFEIDTTKIETRWNKLKVDYPRPVS